MPERCCLEPVEYRKRNHEGKKLYGALCKLKDYEDTGLSPEDVERVNDFERSEAGKLLKALGEERKKHAWIPAEQQLPDPEEYVLVSFENFSLPMTGRYTVDDDDGGTFRIGDDDDSFVKHDLFVNAWMPLPEPYRPQSADAALDPPVQAECNLEDDER